MTVAVVTEVVQGWLLIDLCFLAIFQDETNFITQDFQNSTELSIYFLQLLLSWQLAFGGSYIQKLPIGSYFILAKRGTEPEVHSPPLFFLIFFFNLLLSLPLPSTSHFCLLIILKAQEQRQCHKWKKLVFFFVVVAACNFGFC